MVCHEASSRLECGESGLPVGSGALRWLSCVTLRGCLPYGPGPALRGRPDICHDGGTAGGSRARVRGTGGGRDSSLPNLADPQIWPPGVLQCPMVLCGTQAIDNPYEIPGLEPAPASQTCASEAGTLSPGIHASQGEVCRA